VRALARLAAARLRNQRLAGNGLDAPVDVVRWMGAVQSQERTIARWSVAQRMAGCAESEVDRALAEGTIIRTHVLRPTWHYIAADDFRWIIELTAARVHQQSSPVYRRVGLDESLTKRTRRVLERALTGTSLTRAEIAERLTAARIPAAELRLGYILIRAELDLVICSGPPREKQHTYALADERVPRIGSRDRDDALAELARRYFQSHGPATLKDFNWWSSLTMADVRRAVDAASLTRSVVAEREYWSAPGVETRSRGPAAHLVQAYDEYVVAYKDSRDVYGAARLPGTTPTPAAPFLHTVLLRGRYAGSWRAVAKAKALDIQMRLREKPSTRDARAIDTAVTRYGRFLGTTVAWRRIPS
jgi:hypothetical protein